eukprot:scaffold24123_cov215-Skeletonema_dohrnii-CCMP3373.AAC.2
MAEEFHTKRRVHMHFDAYAHHLKLLSGGAHHLKLLSGGGSWNFVVDGRREVKCSYSEQRNYQPPPYRNI